MRRKQAMHEIRSETGWGPYLRRTSGKVARPMFCRPPELGTGSAFRGPMRKCVAKAESTPGHNANISSSVSGAGTARVRFGLMSIWS
jgi:hypothetical protein